MLIRPFLILAAVTGLLGCSHKLALYPRDGGPVGKGTAEEASKSVTINLGAKTYTGTYIYDGGRVVTFQSHSTTTAYSSAKSATAYGSGFGSAYVPGSGNGRILVSSQGGDSLRCEFQYSNGSGLGVCLDNAGKEYDLQILN